MAKLEQMHQPEYLPTDTQLQMIHDVDYIEAFNKGQLSAPIIRRIGFGDAINDPILIERTKSEVAGLERMLALECGLACNTAGGTHHAFPSFGSGFCIINDMAVTSQVLLQSGKVSRILIFDLDVHQGDGTAFIFNKESAVCTVSIHCQSNFPARKQKSTIDIGLPDGTADDVYLKTVADTLPSILKSFRPNLVLYDAGVDTHQADGLGRLSLTDDGLYRREKMVIDTCLSSGIPIVCLMGGGYDRDIKALAKRHCSVHQAALELWKDHKL